MKLNNKFTLISVALMTGAACLTACSSDEMAENPGLSADGESVKTEFAINIPRAKSARMTESNTQNGNSAQFLGMEGIHLIPLTNEAKSTLTIGNSIGLANIESVESNYSGTKLYEDISIPVGTKFFQFYGYAPQGLGESNLNDKNNFAKGVTTNNLFTLSESSTFADVEFALLPAKANDEAKEADKLINALNAVTGVQGWKDTDNNDLKAWYNKLCSLKAGSANSIKLALEDLYNALSIANNSETQNLVSAIRNAIANNDNALFSVNQDGTDEQKNFVLTWKKELTYPKNINLPEGSVSLKNTDGKFAYEESQTVLGTNNLINADKICFPAALYYATSTAVKATSTGTYPTSASEWKNSKWDNWYNEVKGTSSKVALKDNIQYAVASMNLTVKCKNGSLADSKNSKITVPAAGYTLTGVLIGGQPTKVGYDFLPKQASDLTATIYDNNIPEGVVAKAEKPQATNYTLVLPNVTTEAQKEVNFALEFTNTGKAFYGKDGLVPENGTFYILGKLTLPQDAGTSHIFMKDTKTTVNATIGTLANAYNTIPDLRATNLQLGLSVDLTWETGLQFDVEIGQ